MAPARFFASWPLLVCLAACDSPERGVAGLWTGDARGNVIFTLTLTETEFGVVSGAGRLNSGTLVFPATVSGAHAHPTVALHIQAQGVQSMNFQGIMDHGLANIRGVLNGSGFSQDSLRLTRVAQSPSPALTAPLPY
jgi:hypothetical protein